jgi:hypothetical protein
MKRYLAGIGLGLALFAGSFVFAPHAGQAAPARAGSVAATVAAVHSHAVLNAVAHAQVARHTAVQTGRGRTGSTMRTYARATSNHVYSAGVYQGRYGTAGYARFSYARNGRYGAAGTHNCPNMRTTTGK